MRAALLLAAVWAVWLLAFVVWGWNVSELRSGDVHIGATVVAAMAFVAVAIGLLAALWWPGRGEVAGGLLVTGVAAIGSADSVNRLAHWGELVNDVPDRWTPWVLLDSIGSVPYFVLLVAGVVLLVGGIVHVRHRAPGSTPRTGWRRAAANSVREASPYTRAALLLVAVWAVWLLGFVAWAWTIPELHKPAANDEIYFGYTVMSVAAVVVVAIGLALTRLHGWGEVAGGLVVTLFAAKLCQISVGELTRWGEPDDPGRGSPWVPLDNLMSLPYWVLLAAGVVLLVGGIAHVLHRTHRPTPHAGAAA